MLPDIPKGYLVKDVVVTVAPLIRGIRSVVEKVSNTNVQWVIFPYFSRIVNITLPWVIKKCIQRNNLWVRVLPKGALGHRCTLQKAQPEYTCSYHVLHSSLVLLGPHPTGFKGRLQSLNQLQSMSCFSLTSAKLLGESGCLAEALRASPSPMPANPDSPAYL
jgi:hypothetical protein